MRVFVTAEPSCVRDLSDVATTVTGGDYSLEVTDHNHDRTPAKIHRTPVRVRLSGAPMPARSEAYDNPAVVTFAKELQAWREQAGLNKSELAEALGYTDSYVGQIEHCKNTPSETVAQDVDTYFKTNGLFHRLWKRIIDTRQAAALPPGFAEYVIREREASHIRVFGALLFSGLFQTEAYTRAVLGGTGGSNVEDLVAARMERQAILTSDNPPQVIHTVDERVLRYVIGDKSVQKEQLLHLLEMSERPNITIDVVPDGRGYYPGLTGSFTVLGFEDGSHAVYTEAAGAGMLIEQGQRVGTYLVRYDLIRGHAYPIEESRALIRAVMEEL
ncbi:helix-turn-helix transcriptional regulator [Actinomadura fulvescens]|uniref:Helix-turn-helix transcriptional regulator n=1 Tax=Actinomadura fulvescens TaxID=46160 RepID=A0ABP6C900_9ACTN